MLSLGLTTSFRCPRSENPYSLARKLRRLSENKNTDAEHLRHLAQRKPTTTPPTLPDSRSDEAVSAA